MALATSTDVSVRWARELTPEEEALVNLRLEEVERMVRRRIPDLDQRITAGTVLEADVVQVEADAVLRLVRNPEGYLSETDGNYTYTLQRSDDGPAGRLALTPEEWRVLGVTTGALSVMVPGFGQ